MLGVSHWERGDSARLPVSSTWISGQHIVGVASRKEEGGKELPLLVDFFRDSGRKLVSRRVCR